LVLVYVNVDGRALKKSHEQEKRLIKKCRELNTEVRHLTYTWMCKKDTERAVTWGRGTGKRVADRREIEKERNSTGTDCCGVILWYRS
jgi:hypothetical protein